MTSGTSGRPACGLAPAWIMTLSSFLLTQSGFDTFSVDHDTPHMPSTSPRSTASIDSVVP